MTRAQRIGGILVTGLIFAGTALLLHQLFFSGSARHGKGRLRLEHVTYEDAVSKRRGLLSSYEERDDGGKKEIIASTYTRLARLDQRITGIERRLEAVANLLASGRREDPAPAGRRYVPVARVLDMDTLCPIKGVRVVFPNGGGEGETDANGMFFDTEGRLRQRRRLCLHYPDYDIQRESNYTLDPTDMVTFLMKKPGNASLVVKVSLTVRGKKTDSRCRVALFSSWKYGSRIRCIPDSDDDTYRFSNLSAGKYVIEACFASFSYATARQAVELTEGERKVVEINAKTDLLARVEIRGMALNKRDGKPMTGVRFQCWGDSAVTGEDGAFSVTAERSGLHQVSLTIPGGWSVYIRLDSQISEDLAKKLQFHLDPEIGYNGRQLMDPEEDGVFCDENGCVVCQKDKREMAK